MALLSIMLKLSLVFFETIAETIHAIELFIIIEERM